MKQTQLVILLLLVVCVASKSGITHRMRKSHSMRHKYTVQQDGEEEEEAEPLNLLNPLHGRSAEATESDSTPSDADLEVSVNIIRNDNVAEGKSLEYTELCQLKQGWVNWMTDFSTPTEDQPNMGANKNPIITLKTVFAVLNKQTLSLFENSNVNSLIKTVNVNQMGTVFRPDRWKSANCFQVMAKSSHDDQNNVVPFIRVREPQNQEGQLEAFCFEDVEKMEEWNLALRHFQHCDVKPVEPDVVLPEIEKIDENCAQAKAEVRQAAVKQMTENQEEQDRQIEEQEDVDAELHEISADLKKESAKEAKKRRNMIDEAKKIEEQTEKLEKERECLEKMLRDREQEENNQEQIEIEAVEKDKEESLLKKAAKVVIQVKQEESEKLEQQHEQYKNEQLKKQESIKDDMVRKTLQAELDLPYEVCTDITNENKQKTFSDICTQVSNQNPADITGATACMTDAGFCAACCSMHVGLNFLQKRTECSTSCQTAVDATESAQGEEGAEEADDTVAGEEETDLTGEDVNGEDETIDEAKEEETGPVDGEEEEAAAEEPAPAKRNRRRMTHRRRRFLRKLRR